MIQQKDMRRQEQESFPEIVKLSSEHRGKKALIVVGRMGHGKSAFVNTLMLPPNTLLSGNKISSNMKQQMVVQKASLESVTASCCIRQANPNHQLLADPDEKLFIIDTPGLDSESAPCLVSEQIDNIIMEQKCDIVGIAYVINLADREIGGHGQSRLKEFLKVMKMKKEVKNELIFFVLSKWDGLLIMHNQQDIQTLEIQFHRLARSLGIAHSHKKVVKWVNERSVSTKSLQYFKNVLNGAEIIQEQWRLLRNNIRRFEKNSYTLSDHIKNTQLFWQHLKNQIISQMANKNIKYNKDPTKIQYNLDVKLRLWNFGIDEKDSLLLWLLPIVNIFYIFYIKDKISKNRNKMIADRVKNQLGIGLTEFAKMIHSQLVDQITSKTKSILIISLLKKIEVQKDRIVFDSIGKAMKIYKLLTFYESQFASKDFVSNDKLKVPVAFFQERDLNHRVEVKFQFQKGSKQKSIPYQKNIEQIFSKGGSRIPGECKFFIKQKQQIFSICLQMYCRLPEQSCYCSLISEICVQNFGSYP